MVMVMMMMMMTMTTMTVTTSINIITNTLFHYVCQHHWISLVLCCHGSSCDTSRDSREALQQAECQVDSQGNNLGAHTWMVNHGQSLVSCRNLSSQLKHIASVDGCRFQAELLIPCGNKLGECPVWDDTRALKQSCGEAKPLVLHLFSSNE